MKITASLIFIVSAINLQAQVFDIEKYAKENPEEYARVLERSKEIQARCLDSNSVLENDENVRCGMDKVKDSIFSVYNSALEEHPDLKGKIITRITISKEGHVTDAKYIASEIPLKEVKDSIIEIVKTAKFRPMKEDYTFRYTFDFFPN